MSEEAHPAKRTPSGESRCPLPMSWKSPNKRRFGASQIFTPPLAALELIRFPEAAKEMLWTTSECAPRENTGRLNCPPSSERVDETTFLDQKCSPLSSDEVTSKSSRPL